jgi:single-strand DNA-binding protein
MSKGINKAFLLGHVGRDPEIRSTNGGSIVASFSLATADRQKDGHGNWQNKTEWHNLVAFNRTAEIVRDYVRKGSQLLIEGKIQTRAWDDRETGQKKCRTEIFLYDLTLFGGRSDESSRDSGYSRRNGRTAVAGYGQTFMALGTIHVLAEGRPSTTLVMCPSHITHKWAREILLTVPRARTFLIEDMRNGGDPMRADPNFDDSAWPVAQQDRRPRP